MRGHGRCRRGRRRPSPAPGGEQQKPRGGCHRCSWLPAKATPPLSPPRLSSSHGWGAAAPLGLSGLHLRWVGVGVRAAHHARRVVRCYRTAVLRQSAAAALFPGRRTSTPMHRASPGAHHATHAPLAGDLLGFLALPPQFAGGVADEREMQRE
ncbi:unnamed protein product [Triticum turgidum subsp. durum]|uniref:Uncharacterized protein n=1 Tax=Triticum turgidum subsp. durum TaxID=4567 RepID=A0A9R0QMQ0_TRITD|nr:unnamed protein product [Triticum turgidum subsp. durum]